MKNNDGNEYCMQIYLEQYRYWRNKKQGKEEQAHQRKIVIFSNSDENDEIDNSSVCLKRSK